MFGEEKRKYCSLCDSSHCPQTNMDYTVGCCICFAADEVDRGIKPIEYCDECKKHSSDKGEDLID